MVGSHLSLKYNTCSTWSSLLPFWSTLTKSRYDSRRHKTRWYNFRRREICRYDIRRCQTDIYCTDGNSTTGIWPDGIHTNGNHTCFSSMLIRKRHYENLRYFIRSSGRHNSVKIIRNHVKFCRNVSYFVPYLPLKFRENPCTESWDIEQKRRHIKKVFAHNILLKFYRYDSRWHKIRRYNPRR